MKKILKLVAVVILLLSVVSANAWIWLLRPELPPISPEDRTQLNMMPLPAELEFINGCFPIEKAEIDEFIEKVGKGYGGTVLAVMNGFEKLLRTID